MDQDTDNNKTMLIFAIIDNSCSLISNNTDKTFILDYNGNTISPNYSYRQEQIRDLEKVLCVLSGKNYDKVIGIQDTCKGAHFIKSENGEVKLIPYSDDFRNNIPAMQKI